MTNLEQEILDIINCTINGQYVGKLKVTQEDGFYNLLLHLNQEQAPIVMGYQGTEEQFKKFIQEEIRTRKMERVSYWKAIQIIPDLVCEDGELELDNNDIIII